MQNAHVRSIPIGSEGDGESSPWIGRSGPAGNQANHQPDPIGRRRFHGRSKRCSQRSRPVSEVVARIRLGPGTRSSREVHCVVLRVIDRFPRGKRDPRGIHKSIRDRLVKEDFELPDNRRLTLTVYGGGPSPVTRVHLKLSLCGWLGHAAEEEMTIFGHGVEWVEFGL